jgi:transcriptional regulator with XRE-family HTH domain
MKFNEFVTEQLRENAWTYEKLGELVGMSYGAVGSWVRDESLPDPLALRKLAEVTHTDPVELFVMCGYLPEACLDEGTMRPKVKRLMKLVETLDDKWLDLITDQIRLVIHPRQQQEANDGPPKKVTK